MKQKVPVVIQMQWGENAAAALAMMLGYYRKYIPLRQVREACVSSRSGTSPRDFCAAAESFGLTARQISLSPQALPDAAAHGEIRFPIVALWRKRYYAVIRAIRNGKVYLTDPLHGEQTVTLEAFQKLYRGSLIDLTPGPAFVPEGKPESLFTVLRNRVRGFEGAIRKSTALNALAIAADLGLLWLSIAMLDQVIGAQTDGYFLPLVVGMALCALLQLAFSAARTFSVYTAGGKMAAASGAGVFKKLLRLPLRFFEQTSAGELLERLEKNSNLDYSMLQTLLPRIVNSVQILLYVGILFFYHPPLAFICLILEGMHIAAGLEIQNRLAIASRSITTSSGNLNASLLNGLSMVETIKATGSENQFFNLWRHSQETYYESRTTAVHLNTLRSVENGIYSAVISAVLLFGGVYFISRGEITLGILSAFQSAWTVISTELLNCMNTLSTFQSMRTNIERVDDIMVRSEKRSIPLPSDTEPDKLSGGVRVEDLCFRYHNGDALTLDHVSFDVLPGQIVALVGPTGCGKSTLLKIIADLYDADSGRIFYDGKERREIPDAMFHASLTCVDQEITVFRDSVKHNITMWDDNVEDFEVILSMRDSHIYDRILRDPDGFHARIAENGRNFSGGELQRIELARALCQDPTILLLDEFTSALDAKTEDQIFDSIRERGITCIIVAHRLSTVSGCDRVIVFDKGRIVEQGTPQELYEARGRYYELVTLQ